MRKLTNVPDANESNTIPLFIFVLNCFKDSVGMLASQAIPCIGVTSLRVGRCDGEDEVFVCPQELLPQPLFAQDPVEIDCKQSARLRFLFGRE